MKLKYNFVINKIADDNVAVAVGDDLEKFNGFIKLNDVGAVIFEQLQEGAEKEEIIAALMSKFEGTEEEASEAVDCIVNELKRTGAMD